MNYLNLKSIKVKGEVKEGIIIMTEIYPIMEADLENHLIEIDLSMDKISEEETSGEDTLKDNAISEEETGNFRSNSRLDGNRIRSRDKQLQEILEEIAEVAKLGSRTSTVRDRIRCFRCRDYDHSAKDFTNRKVAEKGQSDQVQQYMDIEEQDSTLKLFGGYIQ